MRAASWRHRVTCPESRLLARASETRWAEAGLLGLCALGAVWGCGWRRKGVWGQIPRRSAGAGFVSLLWPKTAAPLKAVSVGRSGDRPGFRGLRRRGARLVHGWEPRPPARDGPRQPLAGPERDLLSGPEVRAPPLPGNSIAQLGGPLVPDVPIRNFLNWKYDKVILAESCSFGKCFKTYGTLYLSPQVIAVLRRFTDWALRNGVYLIAPANCAATSHT